MRVGGGGGGGGDPRTREGGCWQSTPGVRVKVIFILSLHPPTYLFTHTHTHSLTLQAICWAALASELLSCGCYGYGLGRLCWSGGLAGPLAGV